MGQSSDNMHRIADATPVELGALRRMLVAESLPEQGVASGAGARFLVARTADGRVLGGIGLEGGCPAALLRSLVVDRAHRGAGIGEALVAAIEDVARVDGVETLYLLTLDAAGFFSKLGYGHADRSRVPRALRQTDEFSTLCPASADCMAKRLRSRDASDADGR